MFIRGLTTNIQNQLCNLTVVFTSICHSLWHCSYPHCSSKVHVNVYWT